MKELSKVDKKHPTRTMANIYLSGGVETPASYTDYTEYKVKKGDTLSEIAEKNHVSMNRMLKANPAIEDADKIRAGSTIRIPSGDSDHSHKVKKQSGGMIGQSDMSAKKQKAPKKKKVPQYYKGGGKVKKNYAYGGRVAKYKD